MKVVNFSIPGPLLISLDIFEDDRGYFYESFNQKAFDNIIGLNIVFTQDNVSYSKIGVIRGLHYQRNPHAQGKLIRVVAGEIFDVLLDIRKDSSTYGEYLSVVLSSKKYNMLWVPIGFAHGFQVVSESALVNYKTTDFYHKELEVCIDHSDDDLAIKWPLPLTSISMKDKEGFAFRDLPLI